MDPNYNLVEAAAILDATFERATVYPRANEAPPLNPEEYQVVYIEEPKSWRLMGIADPSNTEAIMSIYGVLCQCALPPPRSNRIDGIRRNAPLLRQYVRGTGLDNSAFDALVANIHNIEDKFRVALLTEGKVLVPWYPDSYEGYTAVEAGARYFTPRKYIPKERGMPFDPHVDPNGILASIRGQHLIHGPDNRVDYLKEVEIEGQKKTIRADPMIFAPGDIVRITVSFVCTFNPRTNEAKLNILLKALTLLIKPVPQSGQDDARRPSSGSDDNTPSAAPCIPKMTVIKRRKVFVDDIVSSEAINNITFIDGAADNIE